MTDAFQLRADVFQLKVIRALLGKHKALGASRENLTENTWDITMCV